MVSKRIKTIVTGRGSSNALERSRHKADYELRVLL